jgi:predicted lipid carrier protein YhbT
MKKSIYSSVEQLKQVVQELAFRLNQIEEVKRKTSNIRSKFRFEITDLSFCFDFKIWEGEIEVSFVDSGDHSASLKMDSQIFHEAMAGTLNLPVALVKRSLVIEGDTRSVLNLVSLGKFLNSTYKQVFSELVSGETSNEA